MIETVEELLAALEPAEKEAGVGVEYWPPEGPSGLGVVDVLHRCNGDVLIFIKDKESK